VARLDELGWSDLMAEIDPANQLLAGVPPPEFDFNSDHTLAQERLAVALDKLLVRFPRRGLERLE
jgi:hypothetical protein